MEGILSGTFQNWLVAEFGTLLVLISCIVYLGWKHFSEMREMSRVNTKILKELRQTQRTMARSIADINEHTTELTEAVSELRLTVERLTAIAEERRYNRPL